MVIGGKVPVILNPDRHGTCVQGNVARRRPVRWWHEPKGRPVKAHGRIDVVDEELESETDGQHAVGISPFARSKR